MSIAVSAVVKPSRLLLAMVGGMCLALIIAAGMIGLAESGKLSPHQRFLFAGICILIAFFGFFQAIRKRKTCRIDISGTGQIRLTQDDEIAAFDRPEQCRDGEEGGKLVQLLENSTIWPCLLLLRL